MRPWFWRMNTCSGRRLCRRRPRLGHVHRGRSHQAWPRDRAAFRARRSARADIGADLFRLRAIGGTERRPPVQHRPHTDRCAYRRRRRGLTHRAVRRLGENDLGYTDPAGLAALREDLWTLRAARAVRCDPEQVVITAGTQQAIDIAIRVLLAPGDEVWVEDPGYPLTHAQLLLAGAAASIPVDAQGLVVDAGMRISTWARVALIHALAWVPNRSCAVYGAAPGAVGVGAQAERRVSFWSRLTQSVPLLGPPLHQLQGLDNTEQVIYISTLQQGAVSEYASVTLWCHAAAACRRALSRRSPTSNAAARRSFPSSCDKAISLRTFVACASYIANSATRWRKH